MKVEGQQHNNVGKREGRNHEFFPHPSVREKLENGKWRRDL